MKKILIIATMVFCLAIALVGCGSSAASDTSSGENVGESSGTTAVDFDGSAYSDTGEGIMYLSTPSGTSENGNIPEVATRDAVLVQIGINTEGMDGSVCDIYIDGMENGNINAGERFQGTLDLQGDALNEGIHTVELVCMDGEEVVIYKKAQYEAVE